MTIVILTVSVALSVIPPPELRSFLARRDYDSAITYYRSRLPEGTRNTVDMRNLARVFEHMREYDSAVAWWSQASYYEPSNDSALVGRWNALVHRDEDDSSELLVTKSMIAFDAARLAQGKTARELTLAYDGHVLADSTKAVQVAERLTRLFPDSPRGYELIGSMFYDSLYPVWANDTVKIPIIRRFLVRYPRTEWRQTFYNFLLSSLFGLKDTQGLRQAAQEMTADDTLDPFRYRYAAALFNRLKLDRTTTAQYARRAIELEPKAKKPANKPPEQWDLEYPPLYCQARAALAEALMAEGRRTSTAELRKAKTALDEALAHFRWDPQQEATPAQLYYLTGRFWDLADAYGYGPNGTRDYCRTLAAGDSRNYWTALADTAMQKHGQTNPEKQLAVGRGLLHYVGPIFTDVTDSLGLEGRRESRVAWGDYNNDGYQDLLLNGSALFRNRAGKGFTNVTDSVGLTDAKGRGGLFADLNNDGWLDLYVSGADGGGRLYKNDSGRFVALSDRAGGPDSSYPTEGAGWADFDNDGWVDLYCANYEDWEKRTYYPDQLFQNQNGYLTDVTGKAGIVPPYNKDLAGRGVNWGDFNNDGYPDCYVSNYRLCENFLWVNNHDSTFTNQAAQLGVAGEEVNNWYGHTIGSAWADYDNDGDLDLFCANLAHPRYIEFSNRSLLYENQLGPVVPGPQSPASSPFADRRSANGIRYEETHSDPAWADVDNDGDLDLYLTSIYEGRRSFLYLNPLGPSAPSPQSPIPSPFQDVTWLSGTRVFNGWGCAFADFDNDGDMDLAVGSGSGFRLFRNDTRNGNHWLKVNVVGRKANRAGIGARVMVTQGDRQQMREVEGGKGTMSQNSLVQHFGLGPSAAPVQIEVSFGPNSRVVLKNVKPNQAITVTERP